MAVAHNAFSKMTAPDLLKLMKDKPVLIDVKSMFNPEAMQQSGIAVWRL
jgi:hypothetical protein